MDVKQIQYFIEVSNTGSFTAAAKKLYLSVPGLVKSMDRLEAELGVALFVRMRSGVTLTPAGQVFARYAPNYVRKHELIVSNVRKAAAELPAHFAEQLYIHLVVKKTVHLQHVAGFYDTIADYALFEKIHDCTSVIVLRQV